MRPSGGPALCPSGRMPRHRDGNRQHSAIADRRVHCRRRARGLATPIAVRQHGLEVTVADGGADRQDLRGGHDAQRRGRAARPVPMRRIPGTAWTRAAES